MLPRALSEIYENIRDFVVFHEGTKVIACAALHIDWADLAEIKSLAVVKEKQSQKLGSLLVKTCVAEAVELGVGTIFCLTYKPAFFEGLGFRLVDKMELPRKVWSECYRCPKFPDCDEVALVYNTAAKEEMVE